MTQTIKQRVTLRELRDHLLAIRGMLEARDGVKVTQNINPSLFGTGRQTSPLAIHKFVMPDAMTAHVRPIEMIVPLHIPQPRNMDGSPNLHEDCAECGTKINTPWGKPYDACDASNPLPTDVIAPTPPRAHSGTALGKARSFFRRFLAGMRG